jgi:hypothetical protein
MAPADPSIPSLVLAAIVLAIAGLLAARQWTDRKNRGDERSAAESDHFARQDARRFVGAAIMALTALGIVIGSRINHRVPGVPQRLFVATWIIVFVLIFVLLSLAWRDWMATFAYARRQRKAIAEERRALLESDQRRRSLPTNGQAEPAEDSPFV